MSLLGRSITANRKTGNTQVMSFVRFCGRRSFRSAIKDHDDHHLDSVDSDSLSCIIITPAPDCRELCCWLLWLNLPNGSSDSYCGPWPMGHFSLLCWGIEPVPESSTCITGIQDNIKISLFCSFWVKKFVTFSERSCEEKSADGNGSCWHEIQSNCHR